MLERARERVSAVNQGEIRTVQGDFRSINLPHQSYDVIIAAAVLHHLRNDNDWESAFEKIYSCTEGLVGVYLRMSSIEDVNLHIDDINKKVDI